MNPHSVTHVAFVLLIMSLQQRMHFQCSSDAKLDQKSHATSAVYGNQLTMNFFVHRLRSLYLGNTFHRATDTSTDLTILLDTT